MEEWPKVFAAVRESPRPRQHTWAGSREMCRSAGLWEEANLKEKTRLPFVVIKSCAHHCDFLISEHLSQLMRGVELAHEPDVSLLTTASVHLMVSLRFV